MADETIPGTSEPPSELHALAERVERLETELAAVRSELRSRMERSPVSAGPAKASPPPPPRVRGGDNGAAAAGIAPPPFAAAASQPSQSLESRLGSQYFNRIAIVLLLIGTAYGLKMAVDRGLIGPAARVIVGLIAGAGLVLWSERFRKRGFAAFSYSLKALGSGVLYLSLWAGFRLYHLLPSGVALGLMVLVTAWNAYMAWAQNSELLAAYALAGGFATPMLLSTGGNHEIFLFCYLLAIDIAPVALVRMRPWPRLLLGAFPLTAVYFAGWYTQFYDKTALGVTSIFIALFAATFATVPLWSSEAEAAAGLKTLLQDILLPLANAVFVGLAFYSVLQDAGYHSWLPWMVLVLAAFYLGLFRLPQTALASAMHLSIAVVFLTIAIPLKASGAWITVSWLVEGAALIWVATRLGGEAEAYARRTLRWLGLSSLGLGFFGVCFHVFDVIGSDPVPLWNSCTGTALTAVAAYGVTIWLVVRHRSDEDAWEGVAHMAVWLMGATAMLLSLRELVFSWEEAVHRAFASGGFGMALLALAILAGMVAAVLRIAALREDESFWLACAAASSVAFNLVAVLTGVREVSALFAPPPNAWSADAALQQSLAISGFLMLYGAVLLAVGFWRRSSFLRWQALALLLFTICKAFLYDLRNLSQGYRVASLLALGVLLLAISFAYQKDWLNLRDESGQDADAHSGAK